MNGGDSEVVIHLFEEIGPDFVRRLDGMFAIFVWSSTAGLCLARDPQGIKPLFYGRDQACNLFFASEIRALLPQVSEIHELPPGTYWAPGAAPVQYYAVPQPSSDPTDPHECVAAVDRLLASAVSTRLMADVPVGVSFSAAGSIRA